MTTERWRGRAGAAKRGRGQGLRLSLAWAGIIVLVGAAACGSGARTAGEANGASAAKPASPEQRQALRSAGAPATLVDLENLGQLSTLFNQHGDVPQLILLLSPT